MEQLQGLFGGSCLAHFPAFVAEHFSHVAANQTIVIDYECFHVISELRVSQIYSRFRSDCQCNWAHLWNSRTGALVTYLFADLIRVWNEVFKSDPDWNNVPNINSSSKHRTHLSGSCLA